MMDRRYFLGVFDDENNVVEATRLTRESGYDIHDVYTPYAVHGLPEAMGLKRSRLTWVCLAFAFLGCAAALIAQFWIAGVDWPVNVGGRPFNSLPAYLPVLFECIVLFGGLGVLFTLLVRARLFPGKREQLFDPGITDDRFVLAVEEKDAGFDIAAITRLWERYHVLETRQLPEAAA